MLLNRNKLFATNHKQRWSIRKLTIGVVSVLVGTTIVFINSTNTVFSDQLNSKTENISKATELISDDNTARTVGEETSSDLPETVTEETVSLVNDNTVEAQNEDSTLTETSDSEETQVITPENEDAVNTNTAETVSTAKQQNEDDTLKNKTVVQASAPVSVAITKVDTHDKASLTRNQIQAQSSGSQYQPKESDERKEESSGYTYSYYAILREVTIVKPNDQEEVLPYQDLGSIYFNSDESENDQLPKLGFEALEAPPIEGYNPPVIPAISISIAEFIAEYFKYLNHEITDVTVPYDGQPIQRQSGGVVPLPDDQEYDDDYDRLYDEFSKEFDEKYKDKYDLHDFDFDVILIKEKYFYTKPIEGKEEKNITRTINVHLPNGEVQTTTQPVTLERTYTSVAGSDEKTYSDWTKGLWEAFTAPELAGYTALSISVDAVEVTSESLDAVVDIYYRTDDPAIVSGKEEKTITRTINVHLPSGEVQTTKQPVTLERTYTSVVGSYTKKYGPWTTGIWEAFTAPELDGYTALPTSVDAVEVTSESLDAVVDIYYRADVPVLPATPVDPTDPSTPNTPVDPTDPSTSTTPVTPTDPSTPTTPVHPTDPPTPTTPVTPTDPSTSTTPVHPTDPPTPTINVKNNISNELASGSKVEDEVDATTDSQEKLPQTGNKSSVIYSIFGLILTSLLGVWAFVRKH